MNTRRLYRATYLFATAAALAGCGGQSEPQFEDKAGFEAFMAAYVGVESVSCVKTSEVTARCTDDASGDVYFSACQDTDGKNCTIRPKAAQ